MSTAACGTLATAHDLEATGFERRQAEAIAKAINHGDERAATKAGVDARLEARIDARFEALEGRIYRALWMQGGAIAALIPAAKLF